MLKYFIKRVLTLIPMTLVISFLMFMALEFTPGDPLTASLSPDLISTMTEAELDAMRESMGLNDHMLVRYGNWLVNLMKGDMGYSIQTGKPIADIIGSLLPATIRLCLFALVLSVFFGLLFGILAAINQNSALDYIFTVFGVIGISVPEFFVGIIAMLVFAINLGWFPAQGRTDIGLNAFQSLKYLVLPGFSISLVITAALTRYTRNSMLDVLHKDYVKTARAKGLPEWKVYFKHAFRNSLMPISVLICMRLPMLIGGSVVIEQVFGYAGIGTRLITAINSNDYQLVLIIVLLLSIVSLIASVLIDLFTALLDPRVRFGEKGGA
ncbi:ABC transporter permease [Christensenellaceae bacterium OttesenSCG-928-M15]|nr:ABC transporter permease [Christensenellaceae bacterium OttesenSCG-928-M15]